MIHTILTLVVNFFAPKAFALTLQDYVEITTVNSSWAVAGGSSFSGIFTTVAGIFQPLIWVAAMIAITTTGIRMIVGQQDDAIEKGKSVITACVAGVVLSFLIPSLVNAFVTIQGTTIINPGAADIVSNEFLGLINWSLALAGVLGVAFIVASALKAVSNPTSEEGVAALQKTVISVIAGIVILAARVIITVAIGGNGTPEPMGILLIPVKIAEAIIFFIGLIAVGVTVYAGLLMLVNFGNDERIQQGKSLLIRAATGVVLVALSFALVHFVIGIVA